MNTVILTLKAFYIYVLLIQSVRIVLSCMTLLSIAVCLLVHVGTLHSGHTQLLTVKQVCILVLQ